MSVRVSPAVMSALILLTASLLLTQLEATNPDQNFPGVVESLLMATSLFCVALRARSPFGWSRRETRFAVIGLGLLLVGACRYVSRLIEADASFSAPACGLMPGIFSKIECALQLPFIDVHELRQLIFHVSAFLLFLGSASLAVVWSGTVESLLIAVTLPALSIVFLTIFSLVIKIPLSLGGANFVYNGYSESRHTEAFSVVGNPGWYWPLLTPALAIWCGETADGRRPGYRLFALVSAIATVATFLPCGQRGGYLIAGALLSLAIVAGVWRCVRGSLSGRAMALGTLIVTGVLTAAATIGRHFLSSLISDVASRFGPYTRANPVSTSEDRLAMWHCALSLFKPNPWFGTGSGTWLRGAAQLCGKGLSFDTAHNFFIQALVELGIWHVLGIVALLLSIVIPLIKNAGDRRDPIQVSNWLLVVGAALTATVQEIDYVPAVYYQFAVIGGLLFGLGVPRATRPIAKSERGFRLAFGSGLLSLMFGVIYLHSISWGGYAFEPTVHPLGRFARWFRQHGTIAAAANGRHRAFSQYMTFESFAAAKPTFDASQNDVHVGTHTLYLRNGPWWFPRQYSYASPSVGRKTWGQIGAFPLLMPPFQVDTVLLSEEGTYGWETSPSGQPEKWCQSTCSLVVRVEGGETPILISAPRPDVSHERPLTVEVVIESVAGGSAASGKKQLRLSLDRADATIPLFGNTSAGDTRGTWLIHVTSGSIYTEPNGGRALGARIIFN